ncbi:hypothetical protein AB205_0065020 [Aquarana catesbeiana]|uniref:SAM domain-containing protein n=1 Tax=Aquarana catesbeiana TaxID=8400 RepID=A0A2G9RFL3_AQUCT|nr:hypothetical protein AB205_0065020 [Aquarana catesbeiana]
MHSGCSAVKPQPGAHSYNAAPQRGGGDERCFVPPHRWTLGQEDSSRGSDNSSYDEAFSPTSPAPPSCRTPHAERDGSTPTSGPSSSELLGINPVFLSSNPSRWSVEEVYEFISSLQGCQDLAEDFRSQEIDGQALLLLKEEHLMSALNIKLGPALKICAKINLLKET